MTNANTLKWSTSPYFEALGVHSATAFDRRLSSVRSRDNVYQANHHPRLQKVGLIAVGVHVVNRSLKDSYKNQTIVDPFSPKLNVVVGRNGSGKSNFFAAIRFVLGDAYTTMGREERQALLHEGSGSAIMSAYVEIVFAGCQGRFQTANDELILRRTIGLKKDEYSVDRKNTTKSEVMQMLETAGFSRANPYYIVPQGRITRLTNMKDPERLDLLKSVAGTQHFTVKKEESLKIMNDTNNKLAEIDDLFKQINARLSELEEEQDELRDFQEQDREKRGLEYTLFHREQQEINSALENIESKRTGGIDDADDQRESHAQGEEELARIGQQIQALKQEMQAAKLEKKQSEDERREQQKHHAQVELDVRSADDAQNATQNARSSRNKDLQSIKAQIDQAEKELKKVGPKFDAESKKEQAVKTQLDDTEAAQKRLYDKQGRGERFKTKKERDDWLQRQIDETFESLSRFKATRMQTTEGIQEDKKAIRALEAEVEALHQSVDSGADGHENAIQTANEDKENLMDERKLQWRREAQLDSEYTTAKNNLQDAERSLSHMMDGNTSRGLNAVRRIKQQHNLTGCYGTIAELIEVGQHHTAIEVVAGASLFHYVVDNEETATKVMDILTKERLGRVTFIPLNRVRSKTATMPQAQDARPLMSLIKYDQMYEKAVQQVFGKAIIAQNLSIGAQYARTHGLTAVTPEGDRSDKKGALTGGFVDTRQSRLKATKALTQARDRFDAISLEKSQLEKELVTMDQKITKAVGDIQKAEQQRNQARGNQRHLRDTLRSKLDLLDRSKNDLDAKMKQEASIAANVKQLDGQQQAYQGEKQSDFKKTLTTTEDGQLENLTSSLQRLRKEYNSLTSSRAETEARKTELELRLNTNLKPHLAALQADDLDPEAGITSVELQSKRREMARLAKDLSAASQRLRELENLIDDKQARVNQLEAKESDKKRTQEELAKSIDRHQRRLEKSIQKKAALIASKQDVAHNMRELGAVPEDMKTKFRSSSSEAVVKRLQKVKESLKKYTSVNKHAFEHYRKSMKSREDLDSRREELLKAKESIQKLIDVLDQRKDEAIERTFKQVSRAFTEVFMKLVPSGKGRLIIQRKTDARPSDESDDDEPVDKKGVENYTGVGIAVSFNSKHDDQQRIQQLSGGQKSKSSTT